MGNNHRVCSAELSGSLDNIFRRWVQDPQKILAPYIKEGMTVIETGCGPGFFSIEIAKLTGKSGKVFSIDLQEKMLEKVREKIKGTELEERIKLVKCDENKLNVSEKADFILAFYMVHEVPDKDNYFKQIYSLLKPDGKFLLVEPNFHVSKKEFDETLSKAKNTGLVLSGSPKIFMSRSAVLKKG